MEAHLRFMDEALRLAREASAGGRKDDMTVLVMRITRPGNTISGENTVQFS